MFVMQVCPEILPHRAVAISLVLHAVLAGCQSCAPIMGSAAWPASILTLSEHLSSCVKVCLATMLLPLLQIRQGLYLLCLLPFNVCLILVMYWLPDDPETQSATLLQLVPWAGLTQVACANSQVMGNGDPEEEDGYSLKNYCACSSRAGVLSAASNGATILRISADGESCGAANCTIAHYVAHLWLATATALHARHAQRGPTMLKVMMHPWGETGFGDLPSTGV